MNLQNKNITLAGLAGVIAISTVAVIAYKSPPIDQQSKHYEHIMKDAQTAYDQNKITNKQYDNLLRDISAGKNPGEIKQTYLSEAQK